MKTAFFCIHKKNKINPIFFKNQIYKLQYNKIISIFGFKQ